MGSCKSLGSNTRRCCADYVRELIDNGIGKFLCFAHHRAMMDVLESVFRQRPRLRCLQNWDDLGQQLQKMLDAT